MLAAKPFRCSLLSSRSFKEDVPLVPGELHSRLDAEAIHRRRGGRADRRRQMRTTIRPPYERRDHLAHPSPRSSVGSSLTVGFELP